MATLTLVAAELHHVRVADRVRSVSGCILLKARRGQALHLSTCDRWLSPFK